MKLPTRNRAWLREIQKAYKIAEKAAVQEDTNLVYIYKLAPLLAAENRSISKKNVVDEMLVAVESEWEHDKNVDPGSEENYLFHFVSAYLGSHSAAGLIKERERDRIMDYINDEWDLFPNA